MQIRGSVTLVAGSGQQLTPADQSSTLVYFVPKASSTRPRPGRYTIYTDHHQFDPRVMAVPLGSTISFVNLDSVDHNVFSVTPGSTFNLGYQSHGQTAAYTFRHAGLVVVSCNVHPSMEVDVMVEPTPYVTRTDSDGHFVLRGLPSGLGTLYLWNPRARMASQSLTLPLATPVQQRLVVTRPALKAALNVDSQP